MPCCLLKRCSQDNFYRTWPTRIIKRTIPKKKSTGTQSSPGINGDGPTGVDRFVWFTGSTESGSFTREIGAQDKMRIIEDSGIIDFLSKATKLYAQFT
ncbi:hypothetical protein KQX54_021892 [Cotesia glomerata]|uniref:Uncharacterized protein n=1 Tax=Cotesia glomerata TaxID=32391 RepID=A0AAV7IX68_COTGL|nr:hypothetical protein KQX54_021892 [Cotesia glomerata]